ncbi:ECF transporter S component [Macrococcus carouselicus]|uniref:Riboflavin transporter n=1 Tax=Macrococcus carouselicus TaxID=69969 RepID=A0A9Q8CPH1_9STAP|nr:ECF transporter S component [Macrococcus carouselicus]TDM04290.1 ECF transporter S component [Macrococcus carouselicus]
MSSINRTKRLILISMLSAISFILMFLKFPLPFLPPYLTIDFSDLPALIGLFTLGPVGAVIIELIKNLLNFAFNPADPIGPIANFMAGASFVLTVYLLKARNLWPALITATLVMTLVMSIMNYFVLLPMYGMIMNLGQITENLKVIVTAGIIPFNIIKGLFVSLLFMLIFRPLLPVIEKRFR